MVRESRRTSGGRREVEGFIVGLSCRKVSRKEWHGLRPTRHARSRGYVGKD